MTVNLNKNGAALMAAYKEVVDAKSDTNWALFTYEGKSNDIRLAEKGDGGLEEMVEELSSGKVMYAFCRVQDPNSGLPKYVLINWTGEGVLDTRKGICANHVSSMAGFLKGAHVTINARSEEDVEPEVILAKVAKASGANFNFHKKTQPYSDAPRGPVGSVYRKTNAVEEIQNTNKENFWAQTQRDEEVRLKEESQRAEKERERMERERKELDEKKAKERALQINQEKIFQKQNEAEAREREQQRTQEEVQEVQEHKRKEIKFPASVQKANEAKSLISQRSFNPRDVFKQREQSFEANNEPSPAASKPGKLRNPFLYQKAIEKETPTLPQYAPSSVPLVPDTSAPPVVPESPVRSASPVWSASPARSASPVAAAPPTLPEPSDSPFQDADAARPEEEDWSDEFDDDVEEAAPGENPDEEDLYEQLPSAGTEDLYENIHHDTPRDEELDAEAGGQGVCARALYDYQAADDTEITFDPDDIITGIEMVDEGWWRGFGPDGHYGMFPANYVELL